MTVVEAVGLLAVTAPCSDMHAVEKPTTVKELHAVRAEQLIRLILLLSVCCSLLLSCTAAAGHSNCWLLLLELLA